MTGPLSSSPAHRARLDAVVDRARRHVPHYRDAYPSTWQASDPITRLPLLAKADVQGREQQFRRDDAPADHADVVEHTSGSTGTPLRLFRTREEVLRAARPLWRERARHFCDVLSTTGVHLTSEPAVASSSPRSTATIRIDPMSMAPGTMGPTIEAIDAAAPAWLRGHPAVLGLVAEAIRRTGRRFTRPLRFVESNSGPLSDEAREVLEETFDCSVADHYGCRETYTIAYSCSHRQLHVLDDMVFAELVPTEGGVSQVAVSSLVFEHMPFIRYVVGDLARAGDACTCGAHTAVLHLRGGRTSEVVRGTAVLGTELVHRAFAAAGRAGIRSVRQFKARQTALTELEIDVVTTDADECGPLVSLVSAEIRRVLPNFGVRMRFVDAIDAASAAKPTYFEVLV